MVMAKCHCGTSAPSSRRCFDKAWSCGKPCKKILNCGQHTCPLPCHPGGCQPCQKTSVQWCQCRRQQKQCQCAMPQWKCEERCNKKLKCGHHVCDLICHKGMDFKCLLFLIQYLKYSTVNFLMLLKNSN